MSNAKLDDGKKSEQEYLVANNPFSKFHRPESDSEQQYDGHMPQPVTRYKVADDDSTCCGCALF